MAETVTIRNQAFRMELFLSEIHRIPLDKWRKICKLMHASGNEGDKAFLNAWFPKAIEAARIEADREWAEYEWKCMGHFYKFELKEFRQSAVRAQWKPLQLSKRYNIFKGE